MINVLRKELQTEDLVDINLTNVVSRVLLYLNTDTCRAVSIFNFPLRSPDVDNFIELDNITDDNLIDWYCGRKNMTREELEIKLNTITKVEG
tara:strand:+ start:2950 stop:3225 length:276 start_codon:yes stop_codon:yes gene_type:complete